jgi:hypothetical protein
MRLNHSYQNFTRHVGRVLVTRQKNIQGVAEVAEPELHWAFMKQPEFQKKHLVSWKGLNQNCQNRIRRLGSGRTRIPKKASSVSKAAEPELQTRITKNASSILEAF